MRILVAGGAGFVGGHVCRRLIDEGHEVICIDDLSTGAIGNVGSLIGHDRFTFIEVDVAAAPSVLADVVLHLASPASPVDYERLPLETMHANSAGTGRLLAIADEVGAGLVYVSTSEIYGDPLVHPQHEDYWGNVDPVGPRSCYDESKRFGEALVTAWRAVRGVRAAIVRVFNTYGPGMRMDDGRVVPELISAALDGRPLLLHGGGHQTRSFMYVSDLVEGLLAVAMDPDLDGQILNIGNPHEVTVAELADRILAATGSQSQIVRHPARPGDPQRRRPDITRVQARYGWRPTVSLDDGLARTIAHTKGDPTSPQNGDTRPVGSVPLASI
jgi:nucleoside-diphosphate-sugar epimerase